MTLQWDDVDRSTGELRLRDGKTGLRHVPITPPVEAVLASIPRIENNPWVITGKKPGDRLRGMDPIWARIRKRAGLEDVRIHDLRHSYASRGLALGEGLPMIGKLLGHRQVATTARYAHLMRNAERASTTKVGHNIGSLLTSEADAA
ncbi:MAG: site-specific integrase [Gammaproteobacteria bacterium]|nr:site-specific integrase [Gammaproteobacteria bacterium]